MKNILSIILLLFVTASFKNGEKNGTDYNNIKIEIAEKRKKMKEQFLKTHSSSEKNKIIDEARQVITATITSTIIPVWLGTSWSFDGYTETPKEGKIACGYFVSTTLNHSGLKINRYKLAQKNPENEAKTIQMKHPIQHFKNKNVEEIKEYFIKNKKDGLYFVGLDFHVGYLLKDNTSLYFIHSNYINSKGVMKENILASKAFISDNYYISDITWNNDLIKKWLLNQPIKTQ